MSEVATIFKGLCKRFQKGKLKRATTFYFSLEDEKWTVSLSPDACRVVPGRTEDADCFFKASKQMFLDVWAGNHTPSLTDFVSGRITSNDPLRLKDFVGAFEKL